MSHAGALLQSDATNDAGPGALTTFFETSAESARFSQAAGDASVDMGATRARRGVTRFWRQQYLIFEHQRGCERTDQRLEEGSKTLPLPKLASSRCLSARLGCASSNRNDESR